MPAETMGVVPRSARGRMDAMATNEEAKVRDAGISSLRASFVGCIGGRKTTSLSTELRDVVEQVEVFALSSIREKERQRC